jgi:PhnB protein
MPRKVDPLNKKVMNAAVPMITVSDVKAAASFYQKAFGFKRQGSLMKGPDGKVIHAELRMRDTTVMLGPEMPERGARSAKTIGGSPMSLYLMVENADKVFAKAVKAGAKPMGEVTDMFWGDRCGAVVDPDGNIWSVATHMANPTAAEMNKAMKAQAAQMAEKAKAATSGS